MTVCEGVLHEFGSGSSFTGGGLGRASRDLVQRSYVRIDEKRIKDVPMPRIMDDMLSGAIFFGLLIGSAVPIFVWVAPAFALIAVLGYLQVWSRIIGLIGARGALWTLRRRGVPSDAR